MTGRVYACCQPRRLTLVREAGELNGIDYLEVVDHDEPTQALRQRTLLVRLLLPVGALGPGNVRVDGGERIPTVGVDWATAGDALPDPSDAYLVAGLADLDRLLVVRTTARGDFSHYTLHLVVSPGDPAPPAGYDPLLSTVDFQFKVECPSGFDCRCVPSCRAPQVDAPEIDYLARDYPSLRRMLLDRLSLIAPQWRERNPADLGVTLVELLAYVGDQLSYRQDAVATEAYLGTARSRISLRRHARLVDYRIAEGAAARAFLRVRVSAAGVVVPAGTQVLTRPPGTAAPPGAPIPPASPAYQAALNAGAVVFETVEAALLDGDLDELTFYTWGDEDCCLPAGATGATLLGHHRRLKAGDVLLLAEVRGPVTGATADADPAHRWPVRLTRVVPDADPALPDAANPTDVTEISWDAADALPFPLCLTAPGVAEAISVAWGNVVLAEHGRTVTETGLGPVPAPTLAYRTPPGVPCTDEPARPVPVRFRPTLANAPLTRSLAPVPVGLFDDDATPARVADLDAGTFTPALHDWLLGHGIVFHRSPVTVSGGTGGGVGAWAVSDGQTVVCLTEDGAARLHATGRPPAASAVMSGSAGSAVGSPADARPAIGLAGQPPTGPVVPWTARADLLGSAPDAPDFVVETEHDGTVRLRFARGAPAEGTTFTATYRVGNGVAGNVGAASLVHIVTADASVLGATNPVPAAGGVQPESADEIRRNAPEAFKVQQRAVTEADWAEVATRDPAIQRAAATWRWTGSWHTVFLTVDPAGTETPPPTFADDVRAELERYRLAGYDLDVDRPRYVPLEVGVLVCVEPDYLRSEVGSAVLTELAALFAPDNFSFAQPVYLSPIYAAAQSVPGVASVTVQVFQRQHEPASSGLTGGLLPMGRLEIARLDNDPNFPERGVLSLSLGGGR